MKTTVPLLSLLGASSGYGAFVRFFDIVNGFLIDAVAHRVKKMGGCKAGQDLCVIAALTVLNLPVSSPAKASLAEINRPRL